MTLGEPKFIPGETPATKLRPYVRFNGSAAGFLATPQNSVFGLNNPILASSETPDHAASFANDGNAATFWQAKDDDTNSWWQVDLERSVTMAQTKITFPSEENYRYKIETSNDGVRWALAVDQTQTAGSDRVRTDFFAKEISGHIVRVTFTGKPAAISELEIVGRLTAQ
jgi:beta-galactosidase